jgi:hypothetical protein
LTFFSALRGSTYHKDALVLAEEPETTQIVLVVPDALKAYVIELPLPPRARHDGDVRGVRVRIRLTKHADREHSHSSRHEGVAQVGEGLTNRPLGDVLQRLKAGEQRKSAWTKKTSGAWSNAYRE